MYITSNPSLTFYVPKSNTIVTTNILDVEDKNKGEQTIFLLTRVSLIVMGQNKWKIDESRKI